MQIDYKPKHVGHGIVADIITDANAATEQLDGDMLRFPVVN